MTTAEIRELLGVVFCPKCQCDTLPHPDGWCFFCDTIIVQGGRKRKPRGPYSRWSEETVLAAIRSRASELGHPPAAGDRMALTKAAGRLFGSWGNAVEAAGFPRPRVGINYERRAA